MIICQLKQLDIQHCLSPLGCKTLDTFQGDNNIRAFTPCHIAITKPMVPILKNNDLTFLRKILLENVAKLSVIKAVEA